MSFTQIVDHSDEKYKCKEMSDCPYTGTNIINKIPWTGEAMDTQESDNWNTLMRPYARVTAAQTT